MNVNEQPADIAANELEPEFQNTVDLVARLAEAAPEQAMDMAVAVVEALPRSAAEQLFHLQLGRRYRPAGLGQHLPEPHDDDRQDRHRDQDFHQRHAPTT